MIQSQTTIIRKARNICLNLIYVVVLLSNTINYFYYYKVKQDSMMQWRLAMISIAIVIFLFSVRSWLEASLSPMSKSTLLTGYLMVYCASNLIGVCAGYTLHSKAFMYILFIVGYGGLAHYFIKKWVS